MELRKIVRSSWTRTVVLAGGLVLLAGAQAQTLDFGSCVRIEDLSARLACYDRAAGRTPASGVATPAAVAPPAPAPVPAPAPRAAIAPPVPAPAPARAATPAMPHDPVASFGTEQRSDDLTSAKAQAKAEETEGIKQIEARVTAVRMRPAGEQVLTLDNGQVWSQTEKKDYPRFEVGDVVVIKRAMLGSFLLTLQKGSPSSRVHRIS